MLRTLAILAMVGCGDDGAGTIDGGPLPDGVAPDASDQPVACAVAAARGPQPLPPLAGLGACDSYGWCYENPRPFYGKLGRIWHRPDVTYLTAGDSVFRLRAGAWDQLPPLPRPAGNTRPIVVHDRGPPAMSSTSPARSTSTARCGGGTVPRGPSTNSRTTTRFTCGARARAA